MKRSVASVFLHPAAIVDLDGTMVDTPGDFLVVLQRSVTGCHPIELARWTASLFPTVGKGTRDLLRQSGPRLGPADDDAEVLAQVPAWQHYQGYYTRLNGQHSEVYLAWIRVCSDLRNKGLALAVYPNKPSVLPSSCWNVGACGTTSPMFWW